MRREQSTAAEAAHLVLFYRAAHKDDDPLPLVFVLPVLEGQLGDLDGGAEVDDALDFQALHGVEDLAQVLGGRDQHAGRFARHGQDANGVLRVGLRLGAGQEVDGVGLGLEPRGRVVAVPGPLAVVHAHHRGLHPGRRPRGPAACSWQWRLPGLLYG